MTNRLRIAIWHFFSLIISLIVNVVVANNISVQKFFYINIWHTTTKISSISNMFEEFTIIILTDLHLHFRINFSIKTFSIWHFQLEHWFIQSFTHESIWSIAWKIVWKIVWKTAWKIVWRKIFTICMHVSLKNWIYDKRYLIKTRTTIRFRNSRRRSFIWKRKE